MTFELLSAVRHSFPRSLTEFPVQEDMAKKKLSLLPASNTELQFHLGGQDAYLINQPPYELPVKEALFQVSIVNVTAVHFLHPVPTYKARTPPQKQTQYGDSSKTWNGTTI